jgi:hypothetical protein
MANLALDISEATLKAAKSRAVEAGFSDVEAYVRSLLEAEFAEADEELEQLLLDRLDDPRPSVEATPQLWAELRDNVRDEIANKASS